MLSSLGSSGQRVVTEQLWEQAQRARLPGSSASCAPWQGVMVGGLPTLCFSCTTDKWVKQHLVLWAVLGERSEYM